MTKELLKFGVQVIDSRHLKDPRIRKNALENIINFLDGRKDLLPYTLQALPIERIVLEYQLYKKNKLNGTEKLNGAEKNVIRDILPKAFAMYRNNKDRQSQEIEKRKANDVDFHNMGISASENSNFEINLIQGSFASVNGLNDGERVPDVPGIYCIKLRKGVPLPAKFGKVREDGIIYIGQASKSLKERLWEEELNHKRPATFFRSIGAMLGYLPPKGSLAGKRNTSNYKFSEEDTEAIRKWMRQSLLVNFIALEPAMIDDTEIALIKKYCPLANLEHNPVRNDELKAARNKCKEYANSPAE